MSEMPDSMEPRDVKMKMLFALQRNCTEEVLRAVKTGMPAVVALKAQFKSNLRMFPDCDKEFRAVLGTAFAILEAHASQLLGGLRAR